MSSKYKNICRHTEHHFYTASTKKHVFDQSDRLIYMEIIGQQDHVFKLSLGIVKHDSVFLDDKKFYAASAKFKIEKHNKNHSSSVIYQRDLFSRDSNIFIGRDDEEIYMFFKKWLKESQTLPYPQGYKDVLLMEAERYILDLMIEKELLIELESFGEIKAYALKNEELSNGSEEMQEVILECVNNSGLLEVDRLRKKLRLAPALGESSDEPDVFVVLKSTGKKYYAVEYDNDTDSVFCLVDDGKEILYKEYNFGELFSDDEMSIDKSIISEDIYIDIDGKVQRKDK